MSGTTDFRGASVKGTVSHGTAAPTGTATAIFSAANPNRLSYYIWNEGTEIVYLGGSTVTTSTGMPLEPGEEFFSDEDQGAVYGITAGGTGDLRFRQTTADDDWRS